MADLSNTSGPTQKRSGGGATPQASAAWDASTQQTAAADEVSAQQVLPPPPACPGGTIYTVRAGDTLFLLAQRFSVSLNALIAANPQLTDPNVLQVGQQICIPAVTPVSCPNGFIHIVQPGDTMFLIAQRFGVSLAALIAANPQIPDPNRIVVGQQICVPTAPGPIPCPGGFIYIVQPGDTMFLIAQRFGVSLAALIAANPQIPDPNRIVPGQQVCVPTLPVQCPNGFIYIVQPGDTMFLIAQRFGVSLAALIAANPQIPDPNRIVPGQQICVPTVPPPVLFWCVAPLTGTNIAATSAGATFVRRAQGEAFVVGINMPPLADIGTQYVAFFMNTPTNTGFGVAMSKSDVDEVFVAQVQNAVLADKDFVIVSREPVTPIGVRPTGPVIIDGSIAQCP